MAASPITSGQIKDGTIQNRDIHKATVSLNGLPHDTQKLIAQRSAASLVNGKDGATGAQGAVGPKGDTGDAFMAGAYRAVAFYDVGDTSGSAIATVACKSQDDGVSAGGVQVLDSTKNAPVEQSFTVGWTGRQTRRSPAATTATSCSSPARTPRHRRR